MDYKLGLLPPKNAPALKFKSFLRAIPEHPAARNYLTPLSNWKVLGNNRYGVCAAVEWSNSRRLMNFSMNGVDVYPTQEQVFELYKSQNPSGSRTQDDGMDYQTLLEHLHTYGGPDGVKAKAFARVDVNDLEEVKAAVYIFGEVWLGVGIQQENMNDFYSQRPLNYYPGKPVLGGHAILEGGYKGLSDNDLRVVTWGEETGLTSSFWDNLVNFEYGQAWVVIWPENLGTKQFVEGIDQTALKHYYQQLTGDVLDLEPPPSPIPTRDARPSLAKYFQGEYGYGDFLHSVFLPGVLCTLGASQGLAK